jgi:prepilin-type N-terminal cleavage/methylation domain-containing protein
MAVMENLAVMARTQTYQAQKLTRIKGFTFVELTIVILLISILVTFTAVNWGSFSRKDREKFVDQLTSEVSLIRGDAISSYQNRVLHIDFTKNLIEVGANDSVRGFESLRYIAIPDNLMLADAIINGQKSTSGIVQIRFYPIGLSDKAILHFEGKKEDNLTIIIWPLTGSIEAHKEYIDEIKFYTRDNPA